MEISVAGPIDRMKLDLNGDTDYLDSNEMDDSRDFNTANELLTRDVDSDSTDDYTLSHDAVGNLTDDDQHNEYVYDVWGRLRKVNNQTPDPVSEYRYNGLNWRISMQHDDDADGDLDAADKTYYFVYDERWRPIATFREDDSDPKEQFVYHAAGNDGRGSASYIDDVVLCDKDADTDWDVQADGTLEERLYYCQNWRHDVVGLVDANGGGQQVEQVRYEAYGMPTLILAGDVDTSGKVDATDTSQIQSWIDAGTYDVRGDVDLDGDVDSTDKTTVQNYTATKGGRTNLSHAEHGNRKGYAGYEFDDSIAHESYHVRHRVLNSVLGQWTTRYAMGGHSVSYVFALEPTQFEFETDPDGQPLPVLPIPPGPWPGIPPKDPGGKTPGIKSSCFDYEQHQCTNHPIFNDALQWAIGQCRNSPLCPDGITISCGSVGSGHKAVTRCASCTIVLAPSGQNCGTLIEELIQMGDFCRHGHCEGDLPTLAPVIKDLPPPTEVDCRTWMCAEVRGAFYRCCYDHGGDTTEQCNCFKEHGRYYGNPILNRRCYEAYAPQVHRCKPDSCSDPIGDYPPDE